MRSSVLNALVVAVMSTAIPNGAYASVQVAYRCDGIWRTLGGEVDSTKQVQRYYVVEITGDSGRYYSSEEHRWSPIQKFDSRLLTLMDDGDGRVHGTRTINRVTGESIETFVGGGGSSWIENGRCVRIPPQEVPARERPDA